MKRFQLLSMLFIAGIVLCGFSSCKKKFKVFNPPLEKLIPGFVEIAVNPFVDSTYVLDNGTKISVFSQTLLDLDGKPLIEKVTLRYRQFDDAVSIYLAGLPMAYTAVSDNMVLQTAGMFEIRGEIDGKPIKVNPDKPIEVTIGSDYTDTRQGFFKLNEDNGDWQLIDIPSWKKNPDKDSIREALKKLKPEFMIPLGPNFYVFDFRRMADIFIGEDNYNKLTDENITAVSRKMGKYGAKSLELDKYFGNVDYKGNSYSCFEMLWKADEPIFVPQWAKKIENWYYNEAEKKYYEVGSLKKLENNYYEFTVKDYKANKSWSFQLQMVSHLRYLLKYSPEQLIEKQKSIEAEIAALELKLKRSKLIEYTASVYSMGIYNCDRPMLYRSGRPELNFTLDGKELKNSKIKSIASFNNDLSGVTYPKSMSPVVMPLFKGTNCIVIVTENSEIGIFPGKDFDKLINDSTLCLPTLQIPLKKVEVNTEADLRKLLEE